jgi:hypothetical protein
MDYRAEIARVIHQAAAQGIIPARIVLSSRRPPVNLSEPAQCCWWVDRLAADLGHRWRYMDGLPGYPGLQPELGAAIGWLREIERAEARQEVAQRHLESLRLKVDSIRAARVALLAQWTDPITTVHTAGPQPADGMDREHD